MLARVRNLGGILGVLASFALIAINWHSLPETIAAHFGFNGVADGFGNRGWLIAQPILATLLALAIAILSRFPSLYNLPVPPGHPGRATQEAIGTELLGWIAFEIIWLMFLSTWLDIRAARTGAQGIGLWFIPLLLITVFGTLGYFILKVRKARAA